MPRNASGTYSLPAGNPVVTGTTIASTWANTTMADLAAEVTDSLSRSGKGGMLGAFSLFDGTLAAPGLSFANELGSGLFRVSAGDWRIGRLGVLRQRFIEAGIEFSSDDVAASGNPAFLFNTAVLRTAGTIIKAQNNGSDRFYVTYAGTGFFAGDLSVTGALTVGGVTGGVHLVADGTQAAPGLAFASETSSGLYRGAAGDVRVSILNATVATFKDRIEFKSKLAAGDTGVDHTFDTATTRTAGDLFNLKNNTTVVMKWDTDDNALRLKNLFALNANDPLQMKGFRDAADAGADFVLGSINTRTAGSVVDFQNGTSSRFRIAFDGTIHLGGGLGSGVNNGIRAANTNGALTLQGNRDAADGNEEVWIKSTATRTAGNLLTVWNNSSERFTVGFDGKVSLANTAEIKATLTNTGLTLRGNKSAADAGVDVVVDTAVDRTAGSLFEVRDNGTERFRIGFDGKIYKNAVEFTGGGWNFLGTASDQTFTTGSVETISWAQFAAEANSVYVIRMVAFLRSSDGTTNAGLGFSIDATGAPTLTRMQFNDILENSAGSVQGGKCAAYDTIAFTSNFHAAATGDTAHSVIYITLETGASAGDVKMEGTKTGGGAANPILMKGSYLEWRKVT